jgi:hypothetical protein
MAITYVSSDTVSKNTSVLSFPQTFLLALNNKHHLSQNGMRPVTIHLMRAKCL